ncbi:NAD(P)-dependent oxidoreductase [Acidithrix ferrooxidans]|uniref:Glyoxylate/hydroxypyruvate reductase B n=1 Tax=Acidithrix ferrooxidans TaxID=1280514 RepID=A0A0D8HLN1_9ACTN|nr:NAD(P)-dependent oxidoreductase [Acidithrix ferrooxidans]KJF18764.1 glyoxylate/hydroxypyruvate reductase B [Acidithrix ferrooxidans]
MQILIPHAFSHIKLPNGISATIFDGDVDELPPNLDEIEIYVPSYMGGDGIYNAIDKMPRLKWLQLLTAGIDRALPFMREGVTLCNAKGVHDDATAELTIALILTRLRGIDATIRAKNQGWSTRKTRPSIFGAKVTIIGAGSIGRRIATLITAFGGLPTLVSKGGHNDTIAFNVCEEVVRNSDIVVVVVPLTSETKGLIDANFLAMMPNNSLLINVARGEVVVTADLYKEVSSGRISAGIDVTDPEPLDPSHPLWECENVVITPHVGGATKSFYIKATELLEDNLARISRGETPKNVIEGSY